MTGRSRLPGAEPPERRLPVSPGGGLQSLPRALGAAARRAAGPGAFPLSAPTWPTSVPRPDPERDLGVDYDTAWARRYPARLARVLLTEMVTRPAMAALADPQVAGTDRLASLEGPVIFAANHASHLDTPLLLATLPEPWRHRTVVAGAADYFFDTKLKAALFAFTINAIPIERVRVSRRSADRATALLRDGWSLLIFPEGGRSPDGWGQPHRPGAAWLAVRTGLPVVPVHVEGTRAVLPRHSRRVKPGTTQVTFGRPIRPDGEDPRRLAATLERAVAALADERAGDWWSAQKRAAAGSTPGLTGPAEGGAWRRSWALGASGRRGSRRPGRPWPPL